MKKIFVEKHIFWAITGLIGFLAYREFLQMNVLAYVGSQNIWNSRRFIAFLFFSVLSLGIYFSFLAPRFNHLVSNIFLTFRRFPRLAKVLLAFILLSLPGLFKWTLPIPENFTVGFWFEFFLMLLASVISSALFFEETASTWNKVILISSLFMAAGAAHAILYKLNSVTSYPFTLYWSEGNRFFDYSTLFGSYRYIIKPGDTINAFINWGMQLPWALPFIIPSLSIGFYRFWYQIVWILPGLLLGLAAVWPSRKQQIPSWVIAAFAIWSFLFLDQGPIYAPLVIGAIFTVIAVRQKLWLGAILIFIISYYTRSARWTWAYAPGIWAGLLALLEVHQPSLRKSDWPKLIKPLILGLSGYLGGQLLPSIIRMLNSNAALRLLPNPVASTSRQPLLWERLYPNPTFPPGILGGLAWAALPVILWLVVLLISKKWSIHWLQKAAALIVAGIFLVVGIIASVKIGGGSNLHNLDMFLVSLLLIAASAFSHADPQETIFGRHSPFMYFLLAAMMIAPVTFTMSGGSRLVLPPQEKTQESLIAVQNKVEEYSQKGEILFIDHRQLLTFNLVKSVHLNDEYEKKYLMDQAMAANEPYFTGFYEDLRNHRFALIINEPANIIIRGSEYSFGEENDAYVKWVTQPLLCAYEPIYTSVETSLQLLVPRATPPPVEMGCQ